MPAPKTETLVARGRQLPADVRTAIEGIKAQVEAVIDGAQPATAVGAFGEAAARQAFHWSMVGFDIQNEDLRAAVLLLEEARLANEQVTAEGLEAFDRLIAEAHDRICAALEAELPIHVPAPAEAV